MTDQESGVAARNSRHTPRSRPSLRSAIDRMCKSCIYDERGGYGTWREQVRKCTARDCALFLVRPQ